MAGRKKKPRETAARQLGIAMGEALGEGLAEGVEKAFAAVRAELTPLADGVLALLRREVEELAAAALEAPEPEALRGCVSPACPRRAVARGLCRRHYARQVYQERKARLAPVGTTVPRRRARAPEEEERVPVEKKHLSPVAPIVRRKRLEPSVPAVAVAAASAATAAHNGGVDVKNIARFFGLSK